MTATLKPLQTETDDPNAVKWGHVHGVEHLRVETDTILTDYLRQQMSSQPLKNPHTLEFYEKFKCVYVNGHRIKDLTFAETLLKKNDIIRWHRNPRRFPVFESPVIFEHEDFLVVQKSHGMPCHPTIDNWIENSWSLAQLQIGTSLFVTHRLDGATCGLIIYAKSKGSQSGLNRFFQESNLSKYYVTLTEKPVPLGLHTHEMRVTPRAPKEVRDVKNTSNEKSVPADSSDPFAHDSWQLCQLEVLESTLLASTKDDVCGPLYKSKIRLLTGRTHQIRCQLSFLGCAVLGDQMYGSKIGLQRKIKPEESETEIEYDKIALWASRLEFKWRGEDFIFSIPDQERLIENLKNERV